VLIETGQGVFERPMSGPAPVPAGLDPGVAAEVSVRHVGAGWGMPDFMFAPGDHQLGSGHREIGDGILLCGRVGVVLQTKCRTASGVNLDRERRWIQSAATDASRQASGTLRTLRSAPQTMRSLRGVHHTIVADRFTWLCVVVIDHEAPPADLIVDPSSKDPLIVLLKSDWDFLFDHLRSTFAVVRYLVQVVQCEAIELGTEWIRFGHVAFEASLEPETAIDPRILINGAVRYHSPLLSLTSATEDDGPAQAFYRMIMDEVAIVLMAQSWTRTPASRYSQNSTRCLSRCVPPSPATSSTAFLNSARKFLKE
jgi:hypothetical protein